MKRNTINFLATALVLFTFFSSGQIITTIAGDTKEGYSGDGGNSKDARFNMPIGLAVDEAGNIYISDMVNGRVRKITAQTGVITTVAGGGKESADGVPATSAFLPSPTGIAVDSVGNIYISTSSGGAPKIRKVDGKTGVITTIAGNGKQGYFGDGGIATASELSATRGIDVDIRGNVYVTDANRIRKISAADGKIMTIAGFGMKNGMSAPAKHSGDGGDASVADLDKPTDVLIDNKGNLYIAEYAYIRKVTLKSEKKSTKVGSFLKKALDDGAVSTGEISTIAGGGKTWNETGPALNEGLTDIRNICLDNNGNLYIVDSEHYRILKLNLSTGVFTSLAGNVNNKRVYTGEGGIASASTLTHPRAIAIDKQGIIYIIDGNCIRKISKQ